MDASGITACYSKSVTGFGSSVQVVFYTWHGSFHMTVIHWAIPPVQLHQLSSTDFLSSCECFCGDSPEPSPLFSDDGRATA